MRNTIRMLLLTAVGLFATTPAAALDCAAITKLSAEGKSPREVAMALSLTTPQVEECLADPTEPERRRVAEEIDGLIAPYAPLDGEVPDSGPLLDQE